MSVLAGVYDGGDGTGITYDGMDGLGMRVIPCLRVRDRLGVVGWDEGHIYGI